MKALYELFVFSILCLGINFSEAQTIAGDQCIVFSDPQGTITLSSQSNDFCWRVVPYLGNPKKVPKYIELTFTAFDLDPEMTLLIYSTRFPNNKKLVGNYTGTGIGWQQPGDMGIKADFNVNSMNVLLALQGSGTRSFKCEYSASAAELPDPSYLLFCSLIIVFIIPALFVSVTLLPCYSSAPKEKRDRCQMILFVLGTIIGGACAGLLLSYEVSLSVV